MEIQRLLSEEEQSLRIFFQNWVKNIYRIHVYAGSVDKIIFDYYRPNSDAQRFEPPPYCAVLLINSMSKISDIVGFLEYDYAECEFIFYPKFGAQRIPINQ